MKGVVALAFVLISTLVWADDPKSFAPPTQAICSASGGVEGPGGELVVDNLKLATWALNNYSVSRSPEDMAAAHVNEILLPNRSPRINVVADENFCKWKKNPNGKFVCSDEDAQAIVQARLGLAYWLGSPSKEYNNSRIVDNDPQVYFSDSASTISCVGATDTTKPPPPPVAFSHFRARGSPDVLRYAQTDPVFKSLPSASLAVNRDDVTDKTTNKVVGVVGYQFDTSNSFGTFELIPYFGINRNITGSAGKGDSVTANTRDVGLSLDGSWVVGKVNNVFIVRPDYLSDLQHHSHILSLNGSYLPVTSWLNAYSFVIPGEEHFFSIMPIFDVRADTGRYKNCGSLTGAGCASYTRFGSQFGFSVASDIENVPLTLNLTDARLAGVNDRSHDIDYLKFVFSWALNKDKTLSLDAGYSDGRREDTALEEKLWSISIGAKY